MSTYSIVVSPVFIENKPCEFGIFVRRIGTPDNGKLLGKFSDERAAYDAMHELLQELRSPRMVTAT